MNGKGKGKAVKSLSDPSQSPSGSKRPSPRLPYDVLIRVFQIIGNDPLSKSVLFRCLILDKTICPIVGKILYRWLILPAEPRRPFNPFEVPGPSKLPVILQSKTFLRHVETVQLGAPFGDRFCRFLAYLCDNTIHPSKGTLILDFDFKTSVISRDPCSRDHSKCIERLSKAGWTIVLDNRSLWDNFPRLWPDPHSRLKPKGTLLIKLRPPWKPMEDIRGLPGWRTRWQREMYNASLYFANIIVIFHTLHPNEPWTQYECDEHCRSRGPIRLHATWFPDFVNDLAMLAHEICGDGKLVIVNAGSVNVPRDLDWVREAQQDEMQQRLSDAFFEIAQGKGLESVASQNLWDKKLAFITMSQYLAQETWIGQWKADAVASWLKETELQLQPTWGGDRSKGCRTCEIQAMMD
ncbi:hypothetical protein BD324DRAFT_617484 [Kockovaella imperatae]|uniref:Uncharacterized protein n=1 Tax=Kockovaella imperatae TaxID=4999 RepID=A0A1Y1ULA8_9TREE|nr:hypothetical protein BD324DRAFT_617484 [Kockovaella imperatae]ORX38830.1 hypothetical protein BD324DRAFT_617484 [Kockovaella imperatae]